jgi:hypothetical protein
VLPYNGTMKYDAGGYLPPGLTTVMNLTGKPEPVLTSDQFDRVQRDSSGRQLNYSPTFNGTDVTAEDIIEDLYFTERALGRNLSPVYGGLRS